MSKVVIVGGGAAGMMAAYGAACQGHRTILLEQNEKLGKKLFITGKGRCNVTNACDMDKLFENVVSNPKFLYSAFYGFDNRRMMALLEEAGCPLKIERGDRVFPVSDHSSDVIAAMQRLLKAKQVEVRLHTKVDKLWLEEEETGVLSVQGIYLADGRKEQADAVVLATGGLSYPATGAGGDGYTMAKAAGHQLKECNPSLVPFEVSETWYNSLQGLSLKNVSLTMYEGKKKRYQGFGEMLFTHFGVSGPLVLSASSFYGKCKRKEDVFCEVDLKPALSEEQLDKRILRDFLENQNRQFKNALSDLFPAKLIPVMVTLSGILADKKVNEITRQERGNLTHLTKHLVFHVMGTRGFEEAIITQGGVHVKEVNPSTMESKLAKGLYFAGEVLDLDAMTGGFNLQIAWSTGYLAGSSIS
ncbi:MAG: NAD(P)/FAD-dependent oxidoreductase [Muribaculaceae bacterium]|nr:NAD(P)/FAD-dependent oxidoreductase [Muribaculaceae bacterium]